MMYYEVFFIHFFSILMLYSHSYLFMLFHPLLVGYQCMRISLLYLLVLEHSDYFLVFGCLTLMLYNQNQTLLQHYYNLLCFFFYFILLLITIVFLFITVLLSFLFLSSDQQVDLLFPVNNLLKELLDLQVFILFFVSLVSELWYQLKEELIFVEQTVFWVEYSYEMFFLLICLKENRKSN